LPPRTRDAARLLAGALVVAMGGSAACLEGGARPAAILQAPDSADQVLTGFQTYTTRDGVRRARVEADTAWVYEGTQSVRMRTMRMTFFDEHGAPTSTLASKEGMLFWQNGMVLADGAVELHGVAGQLLRSEALKIDEGAKLVTTDKPFTLDAKGDHLTGTSLRTDPEFKNVVASQPRAVKGKDVALPGQN
jgi:LPS export ABC transporter protein LptC